MTVGATKIVSSENETLILVDENDHQTGTMSKAECHDGDGILHRAFSLFVFNDSGELLLQKRSGEKRLWPGFWSNSCCSHPRAGETMQVATERRLQDELGVQAELEFVYKFAYQAPFDERGSEHELCSVFLGRTAVPVEANETEIAEHRFVTAAELTRSLQENAESYTPWLKMEWQRLNEEFVETLAKYTASV